MNNLVNVKLVSYKYSNQQCDEQRRNELHDCSSSVTL